jgi:hypothetical protein
MYVTTGWMLAVLLTVVVVGPIAAQEAQGDPKRWWNPPTLDLQVLAPWGNEIALQDDGGFALTLHMTAWENDVLGIGKVAYPPTLPGDKSPGYLVFEDPDGCPSFLSIGTQAMVYADVHCYETPPMAWPDCEPDDWSPLLSYACPENAPDYPTWFAQFDTFDGWDFDETWVEFFSGSDSASNVPADEWGQRPEVWAHGIECEELPPGSTDPPNCWPVLMPFGVGPSVGTDDDSIRYGRWDRLPGLVVIADHGPGLITAPVDPDLPPYDVNSPLSPTPSGFFDTEYPLRAWNLAGLFNGVGHTLLANLNAWPGWGRTTLTAQLVAPNNLFKPVGLVDRFITIPFVDDHGTLCEAGDSAYRLDGGPLTCHSGLLNFLDFYTNEIMVTVRIFIVNGDAPDIVWDVNGNGVIDRADLEADGYEVLTRERTVRFYQLSQGYCGVPYDFDGDNKSGDCVYGARAGGITGIPR